MSRDYEINNIWDLLLFAFLKIYQGIEWFAWGVYAAIWWLWTLTPADWPVWAKALPFPVALLLLPAVLRPVAFFQRFLRPTLFGGARFASLREIRRNGMLRPGGRFLGAVKGRDIYLHGEGHCLTVAAQGGGKTTGLIIPTLLTYRAGPVVVTDPKGAITAQMAKDRAECGPVIVLNPWREELLNDPAFGVDLGDSGFNPLREVSESQEGRAAASLLASLLLPDMPGEDSYWRQEGRELLEWAMLWQAVYLPPEKRTLPHLHALLYDMGELTNLFELVARIDAKGSFAKAALRTGANKFQGLIDAGAGGQLAGIVGTASTALKIYSEGTRLAAHVSCDGFSLADLKGGGALTLFLVCPPDKLVGDDRKWLNLVLALICQQVGKPGLAVETVLLLDEFPALGYLPNLMGSLEQFREAGLRAHLIAQNPGQIVMTYGADGLSRLWGGCETKQFFRIADPAQAQLISQWLGERTERQWSRSSDGRETVSLVGVPLVRAEELTRMKANRQVIMRTGMRPIRANVVPFYKRREWAARVEPNPYRGGGRPGGAVSPSLPLPQGRAPAADIQGAGYRVVRPESDKDREAAE